MHILSRFGLLIIFSVFLFSCMHVITLGGDLENPLIDSIDLEFKKISNAGGSSIDYVYSSIISDEYVLTVGSTQSDLTALGGRPCNGTPTDFVIGKYNKSDMTPVKINNFGGTSYENFYDLIESSGYYYAVGRSQSNLSVFTGGGPSIFGDDFVIAKIDKTTLEPVLVKNFSGGGFDDFYRIKDGDDYFICVGMTRSDYSGQGGNTPQGFDDFLIMEINKSDLSMNAVMNPGGTDYDDFYSVIESGAYYVAVGYSKSDLTGIGGNASAGNADFVIVKFNKTDLSIANINHFGESENDYFYDVIESSEHYIAVGYSGSDLTAFGGTSSQGGYDFVVAKISKSDLSLVSISNFGESGSDIIKDVLESSDSFIATGYSDSDLSGFVGGQSNSGGTDFTFVKIDKNTLQPIKVLNFGSNQNDQALRLHQYGGECFFSGWTMGDCSSFNGGTATTGMYSFVAGKLD